MDKNGLFVVDRIVDEIAVLEDSDGELRNVVLSELPDGVGEGTVLRFLGARYVMDTEEEQSRKERILALKRRLQNKSNN